MAVFEGVTFMRIPRAVLDQVLPRPRPSTLISLPTGPKSQREKTELQVTTRNPASNSEVVSVSPINSKSRNSFSFVTEVLVIVSEECGVDQTELADPNSFADLGVDSLMQLAISSRIREELDLEIPSNLFIDYSTVGALKVFLSNLESNDTSNTESTSSTSNSKTDSSIDGDDKSRTSTEYQPDSSDINDSQNELTKEVFVPVVEPLTPAPLMKGKRATSFLLQGNTKIASKRFFLFPDGGGSATSYAQFPNLSDDVVVFGLNSPFMTTPNEYTCGVSGMAKYYIDEIRRRQPRGPYNFGGWSAGGVIAFEGAQQMIRLGEKIERLILIDAPCPLTIEPLPISLHRWFNSLGLLSNGESRKTPAWLLPHFQASINALSTYNARAIDPKKAPATFIIWCEDGVCKNPTDPRPVPYPYGHAQFLLENKDDLGPQLWDAMIGLDNLQISHVPGNHFTMMIPPFLSLSSIFIYISSKLTIQKVEFLGDKIRQAFD